MEQAAEIVSRVSSHYGFHDLRRAFATMNTDGMTTDALQSLIKHHSYKTTQRYINIARQLNLAVLSLFVPTLKKTVSKRAAKLAEELD